MSFTLFRERSRDVQDGTERHVWGELEYPEVGAIIKVRGTDTKDEEAEVLNISGVSFKLKKDADSEVFLLASSSDTTLKMAVMTIPKDKQRRWAEEHGGIQFPLDPEFALDFRKDLAHITKNMFGVGKDGEFEVKGKEAYLRVMTLIVDDEVIDNKQIKTPQITEGSEKPPGFKGNEQEPKKQQGGGGKQASLDFDGSGVQTEFNFGNTE